MSIDLYDEWIVVAATVFIVGLCVIVHYEGLALMSRYLDSLKMQDRPRYAGSGEALGTAF